MCSMLTEVIRANRYGLNLLIPFGVQRDLEVVAASVLYISSLPGRPDPAYKTAIVTVIGKFLM